MIFSISGVGVDVAISGITILSGRPASGDGGGINHSSTGLLTITDSTITGNVTPAIIGAARGGGLAIGDGFVELINTTLGTAFTQVCANGSTVPINVKASDKASFMTGENICVDGGMMAKGAWADSE